MGTANPSWPRPWALVHDRLGVSVPDFDDRPLGAQIERHAHERPDAPALLMGPHAISYARLDAMASRLAGTLAARGIGRGDVVGLHLPNLPQYAIGAAAASKLGAVISGVSPLLAPPELAHQLGDSGAKALVTLDALAPALAAMPTVPDCLGLIVVTSGADAFAPAEQDPASVGAAEVIGWKAMMDEDAADVRQVRTEPHDLAALQYTGGTTGRPKGAMLSVRTLMHNPRAYNAAHPYEEGAEVIATAFPMFHIAGLSAFIGTMIAGGAMYLVPDPRDTDAFCDLIEAHPPTLMSAVPALYEMLLANPRFVGADFSALRIAASGAAPLPRATLRRLADVIGRGKMADAFGMTETGPCYVFHPPQVRRDGCVGLPMPGAEVRIVDTETGEDVALGQPGEIVTSGPQVMLGYKDLPEETARALRAHDGRIWMHSGDVGSMDEDGYIRLHDRAKDMLIVGGFKVFSVEVEDHLVELDAVAACALVGTPDEDRPGNDVVHLFVAPTPEGHARGDALADDLIGHIRETMAPYKVPRDVTIVDAIPLTPVGKIDKKALRARLTE